MRILLITEALVLGGAETFVLRLTRQLRKDGHDAELLCLNPDLDDPRLIAQFGDIPIHRVPLRGLRTAKRLDRIGRMAGIDVEFQRRRAARWIECHLLGRFDIYHTHLFGADWLIARLKRRHPTLNLVSTLHGDYALYDARDKAATTASERTRILNWQAKLVETLAAVDRWVTISQPQRRQFEDLGVDPANLVDITNGYTPPTAIVAGDRPDVQVVTFVMVARGMREKGWGFLIEAFERLHGDCRLMLIGEGAFLDELRARHGSNSRIDFAGLQPNPVEAISRCDVFVHPSLYKAESLPTVIIEALYAGLPVVATEIGEVSRMLQTPGGELAGTLLVADEATLTDQLTAAMQAYLDDPALRSAHSARASAAFAKFDMAKCAAAYAALYAEVVGGPINSSTRANH